MGEGVLVAVTECEEIMGGGVRHAGSATQHMQGGKMVGAWADHKINHQGRQRSLQWKTEKEVPQVRYLVKRDKIPHTLLSRHQTNMQPVMALNAWNVVENNKPD